MDKDIDEIALFVQKNHDYYKRKWKLLDEQKSTISWNSAAFFLNFFWALYRRMPLLAGVMVANFILDLSLFWNTEIMFTPWINMIVPMKNIALYTYLGMRGNYHYRVHVENKINDIKQTSATKGEVLEKFNKQGGTRLAVPLVMGAIWIVMLIFLFLVLVFFSLLSGV